MPEGDTVWRAARRLHEALAGEVLIRSDFRVPKYATVDLTGRRVLSTVPRGKHLLTRFEGGLTLHTHLRMEGAWKVYGTGERWRGGPGYQIHVILGTFDRTAVGYRLPVLELLRTTEEERVVGHLGPDLLGPDWDPERALANLRTDPARPLGEALLDQRNLAGIGTLYRSEVLFLQGLHPRTPVAQVPDLPRVCVRARQLLMANRPRAQQSTTGDLRNGRQHWVFERPGQPCRRCRTPIATEEFGPTGQERRSYWCPHCQPQRF